MSNGKGKFASTGVVVGQTKLDRLDRKSDHLKGNKVTMGNGVPRQTDGAVGDITVREITTVGLRCYIKTNSGWYDVNAMVAGFTPKWKDLTLENSWVRYNTSVDVPAYMKDTHGFVHLKGAVKSGTSSAHTIATLPEGHRPTYDQYRIALDTNPTGPATGNIAVVKIFSTSDASKPGEIVQYESGVTAGVSLDGISFFAGKKATSVMTGQEFETSDIGHGVVL